MLKQFEAFVNREHLYAEGQQVLLAVSGGRDSVTLCELTARMGQPFAIAHCNFHLRPGDCDRDEAFVRQLADHYNVPIHVVEFDTSAYAQRQGLSIEEAARQQRYDYFEQLCEQEGYPCIATAHHRDDAIETFFINLLRGTGISGLQGIPLRRGKIVRPLLCFSRADIDGFVAENHLPYVDDHTNSETLFLRNRIRLQLIPLLRQWSPSFDDVMSGNLQHLHDAALIYKHQIDSFRQNLLLPEGDGWSIPIEPLRQLPAASSVLFELLHPYGFTTSVVDEVYNALDTQSGARFFSPQFQLVKDRDRLYLYPLGEESPSTYIIPVDSSAVQEPLPLTFCREAPPALPVKLSPNEALFDAERLSLPLHLRRWRQGDRFHPYGMKGSRLVSDLFTEAKLNRVAKGRQWLLCDAEDNILWVVGLRTSAKCIVTTETREVLHVILRNEKQEKSLHPTNKK